MITLPPIRSNAGRVDNTWFNSIRMALAQINMVGGNLLLNSNFQFWQRSTDAGMTVVAKNYVADRWFGYVPSAGSGVLSHYMRATDAPTGSQYSAKMIRSAGNANTSGLILGTALESIAVYPLQAQTISVGFMAKCGANYSPTSSNLLVQLQTGSGVDEDPFGAYTGNANIISTNVQLTTSWQYFSLSGTVPTSATELRLLFNAIGVGTAGSDDSYYIAQVMMNVGPAAGAWQPAFANPAMELAACQRYFEKSYDVTTLSGAVTANGSVTSNANTTTDRIPVHFSVTKRAVPTVTVYSTQGSSNAWRDNSALADRVASAGQVGMSGFYVSVTSSVAGASQSGHWIADAEL